MLQTDTSAKGTITYRRFNTAVTPKPVAEAKDLLKATLQMRPDDSLHLDTIVRQEKLKLTHWAYQQYYKGIQVLYGTYVVHAKNGIIETINGNFIKVGSPSVKAKIDEKTALLTALSSINALVYGWEDPGTEALFKKESGSSTATMYPKAKLVIFYDDSTTHSYRLAYMFHGYAVKPLRDNNIFVDAISGKIIGTENLIKDGIATGTAATKYSGSQTITTDSYTGGYRLSEVRNGVNIHTYNMQGNGTDFDVVPEFSDNDNNWTYGEYHNANQDDAALDVHWGTEKVYDYWNTIRQRNSWNGTGGDLKGYVHTDLIALGYPNDDNAFWDSDFHRMVYGDGQTQFNAVTSLDVIAHETGHGFTEGVKISGTSILSSQSNFETPALNEGISDIWGAVVEDWATSNKQTWEIGEDIMKDGYPCLRSLSNPQTGGDPTNVPSGGYPGTYHGTHWYTGSNESIFAHVNSTVLSHWFYLLSAGSNGIGIDKAASIVWQAEIGLHLQPASNYASARQAMIDAATDLYCANSPEVKAVTNAWYAVGVGTAYSGSVMSISGPSYFCTNGTYSVINKPTGITSTLWSSSNTSAATINTSGIASKVNNGYTDFSATLTGASGCTTTLTTATLPVGYTPVSLSSSSVGCSGNTQTWSVITTPVSYGSNWHWTVDYLGQNAQIYIYNPYSASTDVDVTGGGTIKLTYTDLCGNAMMNGLTVYSTCHSGYGATNFTVAPDPAQNDVTVSAVTTSTLTNAKTKSVSSPNFIYGIKITDALGILRKSFEYKEGIRSIKISVADLNSGVYSLSVFDGQQWQSQNIIVQK